MDCKIVITCAKCRCKFELRPEEFKDRDELECPNCRTPFPQDTFETMRTGIKALKAIPGQMPEGGSGIFPVAGQFTLSIKEYDDLSILCSSAEED